MSKMKNNRVKPFFIVALCVSLAASLYARPRTVQQAQQIASEFAGSAGNLKKTMGTSTRLAYTRSGDSQPLFYVFNRDAGFVIVSADDRAPEILGYSDAGPFDIDSLPDNFRYLLNSYATELEVLAAAPEAVALPAKKVERSTQATGKSVAPLLGSILWDQGDPYNLQCPVMSDGGRSVVGCVATAMAQIMGYHQWPEKGTGTIPGYTTRSQGLVIDEENIENTYYDWDHMTPIYTSESTDEERNAVATLMYHCGISVGMDYGYESGAFSDDVPEALATYFGYNKNMKLLNRIYYTKTEWDSIIRHELDEKRPVYYSGSSAQGGHAFVCDGYDTNGLFHINWGWSGMSNGYFTLSNLTPTAQGTGGSNGGFNWGQAIITGIQSETLPDDGLYQLCMDTTLMVSRTEIGRNESFEVWVNGLWNRGCNTFEGNIGPALCDDSGHVVCPLELMTTRLERSYGWYSLSFGEQTIPGTVPDGSYRLHLVYQAEGSSDYHVMRAPAGTSNYLQVTVSGGRVTFADAAGFDVDLQLDALELSGNLYQNRNGRFTYTVTNRGCEYVSSLVLVLESATDGSVAQWGTFNPVSMAPGETQTFEVSEYITTAPGEYNLYLCYDEGNSANGAFSYVSVLGEPRRVTVYETPAEGTPDLQLVSPLTLEGDGGSVNRADIRMSARVANRGAYFANDIVAFIFSESGDTYISYIGYQQLIIDADEEVDVNIDAALTLDDGSYVAVLYYYNGSDWIQFTPYENSFVYFTLSTPTGLDEVDGAAGDLAVYPNPVQETLHVRQAGEVIDLAVYDLSGRELLRLMPVPGEEVQVPVADLQAGTYLLRVRTAREVKTTQFIKK